jgi:hypothetical protein
MRYRNRTGDINRISGITEIISTVNVDFIRIEYMVLAKYQHLSILELILQVKQHILILCKNLLWLLF